MESDSLWLTLDHTAVMRQVFFWVFLLIIVPAAVQFARLSRLMFHAVFFVMIWAICEPDGFGLSFFAHPEYRAAVRGVEFYLSDFCALILAITMWTQRHERPLTWAMPLLLIYALYLLVGLVSWTQVPDSLPVPGLRRLPHMTVSPPPIGVFETGLYPLFELVRTIRNIFLMWVTANVVRDRRSWPTLVWAAAFTVAYLGYAGLKDRYVNGLYRVAAGLLHPNDYGAYAAMVGALILPLIFQNRRIWFSLTLTGLALVVVACEILSVSRSGLAVYALAMVISTVFAAQYHWSKRNLIYVMIGIIGSSVFAYIAKDTLTERFVAFTVEDSVDERVLFNRQGVAMAHDRLFGVGLGNFSANSWDHYADAVEGGERLEAGVPAHNIWYLTLGELGYPGLFVFALLWLRVLHVLWVSWRSELGDFARAILLGAALCILMVHLSSLVHFSYRNVAVYSLTHVAVGIALGFYSLARSRGKVSHSSLV